MSTSVTDPRELQAIYERRIKEARAPIPVSRMTMPTIHVEKPQNSQATIVIFRPASANGVVVNMGIWCQGENSSLAGGRLLFYQCHPDRFLSAHPGSTRLSLGRKLRRDEAKCSGKNS